MQHGSQHLSEEVCHLLLNKLLPDEDIDKVISHLEHCERCEDLFRRRSAQFEKLQSEPLPSITTGAPFSPGFRVDHAPRPFRLLASTRVFAALSAVALIALVFALFGGQGNSAYWLPELGPDGFHRSGSEGNSQNALSLALDAYNSRKLDRAETLLSSLVLDGPSEALRRMYLVSTYLNQGSSQEAFDLLSEPHTPLPSPFHERWLWLKYLVLKDMGNDEEAMQILDTLKHSPGEIGELARAQSRR